MSIKARLIAKVAKPLIEKKLEQKRREKSDNPVEYYKQSNTRGSIGVKKLYHRTARTADRFLSSDYKNYRLNMNGKKSLDEFSLKELKYLNRDYKTKGLDNTAVKAAMKDKKIDITALRKNGQIRSLYTIKTDKGNIQVGADLKTGKLMISDKNYKDIPNIRSWENYDKKALTEKLAFKGNVTNISQHDLGPAAKHLSPEKYADIKTELHPAIIDNTKKFHKDIFQIEDIAKTNPQELKGTVLKTNDPSLSGKSFIIVGGDKDNLIVRRFDQHTDKSETEVLNVNRIKSNEAALNTKLAGAYDKKTLIGYDKSSGTVMIGSVKNDKTVEWKTREDYQKTQTPEKNSKLDTALKIGSYVVPGVAVIATLNDGKKIYQGMTKSNKTVLSTTRDKWHDASNGIGKSLSKLAEQNEIKRTPKLSLS